MRKTASIGLVAILMAMTPAAAQVNPVPAPTTTPTPSSSPNTAASHPGDIVVTGKRDDKQLEKTLGAHDMSMGDPTLNAMAVHQRFLLAQRVGACAARGKLSTASALHAVVDGPPNQANTRYEQDRLVRRNATCSEGAAMLMTKWEGTLGDSIYYRGAFTIAALQRYAPDLTLTREQTGDPQVQARFNGREVPLNRDRLPADRLMFEIAVCMVRLEPERSVRLALDEMTARDTLAAERPIIDGARVCVGDARKVAFDPTQLRIYIADAVYRWAVAAKGVGTLINSG